MGHTERTPLQEWYILSLYFSGSYSNKSAEDFVIRTLSDLAKEIERDNSPIPVSPKETLIDNRFKTSFLHSSFNLGIGPSLSFNCLEEYLPELRTESVSKLVKERIQPLLGALSLKDTGIASP
jgi:hypothetical protein